MHDRAAGGAGGYTSALVGAGWMQPIGARWHVGAELLAGAGGGGGVDGDGALVEPRVFVGVQLTPALGLRAGAGPHQGDRRPARQQRLRPSLNLAYGVSSGN